LFAYKYNLYIYDVDIKSYLHYHHITFLVVVG
jgi:hypothetical protein